MLIGGHMDSVPNGGWLDGCLNVLAGAEVLRRIADEGTPPVTVGSSTGPTRRARDSAARCSARPPPPGRCPIRTSCASSSTARASRCPTRSARSTSTSTARSRRGRSSTRAAAYLELHIEQGPVLESLDLPLGVVLGTFGVERSRITWTGQAAHAGSTPMDQRRDALAGRREARARDSRRRARDGRRRRLHVGGRRRAGRASSRRSSRRPSSCSTSVTSTRGSSPRCSRARRSSRAGSPRKSGSTSPGSGSGRSSRSCSTRR